MNPEFKQEAFRTETHGVGMRRETIIMISVSTTYPRLDGLMKQTPFFDRKSKNPPAFQQASAEQGHVPSFTINYEHARIKRYHDWL